MEPLLALTPFAYSDVRGKKIRLSQHFSYPQDAGLASPDTHELFLLHGIVAIAEEIRELADMPISVTSGYRSLAKQEKLRLQGLKASTISPHSHGAALDLIWAKPQQALQRFGTKYAAYKVLSEFAEEAGIDLGLGPWLRIGWEAYIQEKNMYLVHVDIVPILFDPNLAEFTSQLPDKFYPYGRENPRPRDWKGGIRW